MLPHRLDLCMVCPIKIRATWGNRNQHIFNFQLCSKNFIFLKMSLQRLSNSCWFVTSYVQQLCHSLVMTKDIPKLCEEPITTLTNSSNCPRAVVLTVWTSPLRCFEICEEWFCCTWCWGSDWGSSTVMYGITRHLAMYRTVLDNKKCPMYNTIFEFPFRYSCRCKVSLLCLILDLNSLSYIKR